MVARRKYAGWRTAPWRAPMTSPCHRSIALLLSLPALSMPVGAESGPDLPLVLVIDYALHSQPPVAADSPAASSYGLDLGDSARMLPKVELAAIHGKPLAGGSMDGKIDSASPVAEPQGLATAESSPLPTVAGVHTSLDGQ